MFKYLTPLQKNENFFAFIENIQSRKLNFLYSAHSSFYLNIYVGIPKQSPGRKNNCFVNFSKIHRKIPVLDAL